MNIFILSPSCCPIESARFHCDQHLHKMILESAQMLSTAFHLSGTQSDWLYKPAYQKHPCTIWVSQSPANMLWLCNIATELEVIRQELNHPYHSSSDVIKFCLDYLQEVHSSLPQFKCTPFPFAGPAHLQLNQTLTIPQKYQAFYAIKHAAWKAEGRGMTYKNRPIPYFMQDVLT